MPKALALLGATPEEEKEVTKLFKASESEINEAEKNSLKLGELTANSIKIDTSRMREPVKEITDRLKDGIRANLPANTAGALISGIDWTEYYAIREGTPVRLEIVRNKSTGALTVWEIEAHRNHGRSIRRQFKDKDDGTPLPAEQIFDTRWKPFLKGVMIPPKDSEGY